MRIVFCFLAFWGTIFAVPASAEITLNVDRYRAYLIYEDEGNLSENVASGKGQIIARDENGSSIQILLDIVVSGPENTIIDSGAFLYVWVTAVDAQTGDRAMIDKGWPINYVGQKSETVRSIIIEHGCEGFIVNARVDIDENNVGETHTKQFNITCGG